MDRVSWRVSSTRAPNDNPDPDACLRAPGARRVRQKRRGCEGEGSRASVPLEQRPKPVCVIPTRRSPRYSRSGRYILHWRDEWGASGHQSNLSLERAMEIGAEYGRPRAWAGIIDTRTYQFVDEYGTRFAALQAQGKAQAQNKPPARATGRGAQRREVAR
jgi:hypothetical protein